jgi:putative membrane protein
MTALVVCLASVAYAHGNDKSSDNHASKSNTEAKSPDPKSAPKPLSDVAGQIVNSLHGANLTEVAAGKLAEKNADSAAIKRYGRMLAKDHAAADRKLAALASRRAFTLIGEAHDLSALEAKKGAAFDGAFITQMIKDHGEAIAMVKHAQATCDDKEVHALLDQTLPVLQKHQSEAVKLQQQAYAQ